MGNATSSSSPFSFDSSSRAGAKTAAALETVSAAALGGGVASKTWATTDHTLSGPWSFLVKEEVQCLCEGGRSCTREHPGRQRGPNAVPGLHSNWVGGSVLAMARPWQEHVVKHDLPARFAELNIGMILNLQEVGEHDSCGPGNLPGSGFSYSPESFMAARVAVYNFSWRDMGVPSLEKMMDIVQVMQYTTAVEGRKVAVHCHAGLGRTGLAIACFLVASGQAASAAQAVAMVRAARPGSVQTAGQVLFVSIFEQYLSHLRCVFKVADLAQLNLGNTAYIVTKVCRRISRSLSGSHHATAPSSQAASGTGTPDALAAVAAAALGPLATASHAAGGPAGSSSAPSTASASAAGGGQVDWASATYDVLTPAEAAQLQQQQPAVAVTAAAPTSAAEAAATAELNLGAAAGSTSSKESAGLIMHARRLSGGGSLKLMSNLKAIDEEGDKPVHIIQTDSAVTEVYGHGLTIIRATDSARKLYAGPPRAIAEQRLKEQLLTAAELGLDQQLPWNDRFVIRPEAFKAEGWLPEPPASYTEALRRQQRLLHGAERRRCLHLHKLMRAAAKALTAAVQAYNAVPAHSDAASLEAAAAAGGAASALSPSAGLKRMHSRSRSNASAIDQLAIAAGGLGLCSLPAASNAGGTAPPPGAQHPQQQQQPSSSPVAAVAAAASGLMSKQQQQQQHTGSCAGATTAAALLPGIHLGPPGTPTAGGAPGSSGGDTRRLSRSAKATAAAAASAPGSCVTPCLAGCCAPSFGVGLLLALLYKGRFPEEYEAQWATCPRLKALGLDEGHAVCQALQAVKLAVNAGDFTPLEAASGAVAVCVLSDWFEGFVNEALSEPTLELLVDEAEHLLAQAMLAAAAAAAAAAARGRLPPLAANSRSSCATATTSPGQGGKHVSLVIPVAAADSDADGTSDDGVLARKAAARSVCASLAPHEQDLCLVLAAVLRHARLASLDDSRLQRQQQPQQGATLQGAAASGSSNGSSSASLAAVEPQVDAAMAVLYRLVAGWLLGPLAAACLPALEAVAAFLHLLTIDDDAYSCLLQLSTQGVRKARSAPAGKAARDWGLGSPPASPRSLALQPQQQQQQQLDSKMAKLKARLLAAGKPGSSSSSTGGSSSGGGSSSTPSASDATAAFAEAFDASSSSGAVGKSKLSHMTHVGSSPELTALSGVAAGGSAQGGAAKLAASSSRLGRTLSKLLGRGSECREQQHGGGGSSSRRAASLDLARQEQPAAAATSAAGIGCADLLAHKLSLTRLPSLLASKHRVQQEEEHQGQQQQEETPSCSSTAPPTDQQAAGKPPAWATADSRSELVHAGVGQELCVGRQASASATAAPLEGGQPGSSSNTAWPDVSSEQGPGVLGSPPQCQSPEPPPEAPRQPGSSSRHGGHLHVPTLSPPRPSASGVGAAPLSPRSKASSVCSLGSVCSLLVAAASQQQQHHHQQTQHASPPVHSRLSQQQAPEVPAATAGSGAMAHALSAGPSVSDVASSQALSVSALSDMQFQQASLPSLSHSPCQ